MVDTSLLDIGSRFKIISTNTLVDYIGNNGDLLMVINPDGSVTSVSPDDIELVALP